MSPSRPYQHMHNEAARCCRPLLPPVVAALRSGPHSPEARQLLTGK
jgi:hypothetical protein